MTLTLRELRALKPGDVIPTDLQEAITVSSGGAPLFRARFGASRGFNALRIIERINTAKSSRKHHERSDEQGRRIRGARALRRVRAAGATAQAGKAPERARFDELAQGAAKPGNGGDVSLDMILDVP